MNEVGDYVLPMPATLGVVADCWKSAESLLRKLVRKKYYDLNEECITTLFQREIRVLLLSEVVKDEIRDAFQADLRQA